MQEFFEEVKRTSPLQIDPDWILPHDSDKPNTFSHFPTTHKKNFSSPHSDINVSVSDLYNAPINL